MIGDVLRALMVATGYLFWATTLAFFALGCACEVRDRHREKGEP